MNVILVIVDGSLLLLALRSSILKRVLLSSVLLALIVGVAVGPQGLALVDPARLEDSNRVLEELAGVTLAMSLMAAVAADHEGGPLGEPPPERRVAHGGGCWGCGSSRVSGPGFC